MLAIPLDLSRRYEARLAQQNILAGQRPHYHKWLRYYLDFCDKYSFAPTDRQSLPAFQEKLRAKHQPEPLCHQAGHAVDLYWEMVCPATAKPHPTADPTTQQDIVGTRPTAQATLERAPSHLSPMGKPPTESLAPLSPPTTLAPPRVEKAMLPPRALTPLQPPTQQAREAVGRTPSASANPVRTLSQNDRTDSAEFKLTGASWIWVYDGLTSAIKVRHYSPKTLEAYQIWTQKFQTFTRSKDPRLVTMEDVKGFLSFLAVEKKVAASSQNQAFNALLFLFRHVLKRNSAKSRAWCAPNANPISRWYCRGKKWIASSQSSMNPMRWW